MCNHPVTGAACHCGGCHLTFTSLSAFDRHQRWIGGQLTCLDPEYIFSSKGKPVFSGSAETGRWSLAGPDNFLMWQDLLWQSRWHCWLTN